MTQFIAVKVHYDHRARLPQYLKYSDVASPAEYQEYLNLFTQGHIGGEGFHECLNFKTADDPTLVYLPPNHRPAENRIDEDFIIFSFTYRGDQEMPARIVGVHAGARILSRNGTRRTDVTRIEGVEEPLAYHATAPAHHVTLFNPPLEYNSQDGRYTREYRYWGNGLRYISKDNAKNILDDAIAAATEHLPSVDDVARLVTERQLEVLQQIEAQYFLGNDHVTKISRPITAFWRPPLPDKELGYLGEKVIYDEELRHVKSLGLSENKVEWISRSIPFSPFDIKSVRKIGKGYKDHFVEVKSSKVADHLNVYISAQQLNFFEAHQDSSRFKFVTFDTNKEVQDISEFSLDQLYERFDLIAIEYRLAKK